MLRFSLIIWGISVFSQHLRTPVSPPASPLQAAPGCSELRATSTALLREDTRCPRSAGRAEALLSRDSPFVAGVIHSRAEEEICYDNNSAILWFSRVITLSPWAEEDLVLSALNSVPQEKGHSFWESAQTPWRRERKGRNHEVSVVTP